MKKLFLVVALTVSSLPAMAADVDVFGGYSLLNADSLTGSGRDTMNGWQTSASAYFTGRLGVAADLGGHYKTYSDLGVPASVSVSSFEYLFGPQIKLPVKKLTPFAHVLFGGLHQSADAGILGNGSANGFMMGIGGGVDLDVHQHVAIRLVQVDWLPARIDGDWATDAVRLGFGVVFKLGH